VKYTDYKRFGADTKILYGKQEIGNAPQSANSGNQAAQPK
jgi:hypothetical protein